MKGRRGIIANVRCTVFALIAVIMLLAAPVVRLQAQSFFGGIVGTVADANGAAVPGATVTVTNTGTNDVRSMKSDAQGNYNFVNLQPATYKVEVEAQNFKRFVRTQVEVQVGATARLDVPLEIGSASETVEVTTQAPLLDTESSQMGQQVEGKTVQEMPLNGRNAMNLISLTAGVVPQGGSMGSTTSNQSNGATGKGGWGNYQIGGGIANHNAAYVDGVAVNTMGNNMAYIPAQDIVQEFNVASNSVTADFGRFSGGAVNMTTKSGNNQLHGSAYEYIRNAAFNANDWYNKKNQLGSSLANKPAKFNQNQFGGTVSGPIVKDKLFFLFGWEGLKIGTQTPTSTYIPTTAMKAGKIPYTLSATGAAVDGSGNKIVKITDPLGNCTPVQNNTGNYWDLTACTVNPAYTFFKDYYPDTNTGASTSYFLAARTGDDSDQYNARVDYNLSQNQRIFARYSRWHVLDVIKNVFPAAKYNAASAAPIFTTQVASLADTYTINPTTILDARISWLMIYFSNINATTGVDASPYYTNNAFVSQQQAKLLPGFSLNNKRNFTVFNGLNQNTNYSVNDQISVSLTKISGQHTIKVGTELRIMNRESTGNATSGVYNYTGNYTGDEWSDLMLGYAHDGTLAVTSPSTSYNAYQAYYLQDTWHPIQKLTLNLGVRYELPGSVAEAHDKAIVLLPNSIDPYTGVKGTLSLVKDPNGLYTNRSVEKTEHRAVAPRIGIVYRLGSSTVIRGGYGVNFLPPDLDTTAAYPFTALVNSSSTQFNNTGALTPANVTSGAFKLMSNPFPNGLIQPRGRTVPNFITSYLWSNISGADPTVPFPYAQQWNLSLSRQMKGDWTIDTGYAGSKGTHLPSIGGAINQLDSRYWAEGAANSAVANNSIAPGGVMTTPIGGYTKSNVTLGQSRRPFPYFTNVTNAAPRWSASNWHSLQVKVQKRFKSGGLIMGSYTWSKMLTDTDTPNSYLEGNGYGAIQDMTNHRAEHSLSTYNVPNRIVISYVMPLPIGHGQKYLANMNRVVDRIVSGWALNGITSFQSGYSMNISESAKNNLTNNFGAGTLRPDFKSGCVAKISGAPRDRLTKWFNTDCFEAPGTSTNLVGWALGNSPRVVGSIQSQGTDNWDMSFVKNTKIAEKINFELRGEFFNIWNRTQFAAPVSTRGSSNFGQISTQANKPRLVQFSGRISF